MTIGARFFLYKFTRLIGYTEYIVMFVDYFHDARVIVRLSESMLDECSLREEIQENSTFASYELVYL